MSRIGRTPVAIPKEVTITTNDHEISVKGPKGEIAFHISSDMHVDIKDDCIVVATKKVDTAAKALHGFVRSYIANMVQGVTAGWTKTLELSGVGYRAAVSNSVLTLTIGFSHPVVITPPKGIAFSVTEGKIIIQGIDKQLVGQIAATIRSMKKPEPYKGKGIKYLGEYIRRKAGKSAKAIGAPTGVAK